MDDVVSFSTVDATLQKRHSEPTTGMGQLHEILALLRKKLRQCQRV